MNYELPSYCRAVNPERGRHLIALRDIDENELIFNERPLLSLQTLGNACDGALVCGRCKCFLNYCKETQIKLCAGEIERDEILSTCKKDSGIVSCRGGCGEVYCSKQCEEEAWRYYGHAALCTGHIDTDGGIHDENNDEYFSNLHPLLKFKMHAIQTNEIFLLVADWLVQVLYLYANALRKGDNLSSNCETKLSDILFEYCDFTMNPWWDIVDNDDESHETGTKEDDNYNHDEYDDDDNQTCSSCDDEKEQESEDSQIPLNEVLRNLCQESANLFRELLKNHLSEIKNDVLQLSLERAMVEMEKHDLFSELMFAKIIGSFEQNAIGIRARHPLCSDILFGDTDHHINPLEAGESFRIQYGQVLSQCLKSSGKTSNIGDSDEEKLSSSSAPILRDLIRNELSQMNIRNNDDTDQDDEMDDLDEVFVPLDGTAMFSIACKMNHSCSPNVMVRYRNGWGRNQPLVLQCISLRRIKKDEELCISYIDCDASVEERQQALLNYGFQCNCVKCTAEMNNIQEKNLIQKLPSCDKHNNDDLFGSDTDIDEESDDLNQHKCLESFIQSSFDHQLTLGSIPIFILAPALQFLLREGSLLCKMFETNEHKMDKRVDMKLLHRIMKQCLNSAQVRHLRGCGLYGRYGERESFSILKRCGSWPHNICTEAYGCFAVATSISYANEGRFLDATHTLDKAFILSPLKRDDFEYFCTYIYHHAQGFSTNEIGVHKIPEIPLDEVEREFLSKPLSHPCTERQNVSREILFDDFVDKCRPLVIRSLVKWKAMSSWLDLQSFTRNIGHRVVPIEIGAMSSEHLQEKMMTVSEFVLSYIVPSSNNRWTFKYAGENINSIAYMAQFRLFDMIPELLVDISPKPSLLGDSPVQINGWFGSGGTRTPLHFDSYDNILVQVVGSKYIRLYNNSETKYLYAVSKNSKSTYQQQGNFSEVKCEEEDLQKHPLVSKAKYTELVLNPGDGVYIPAGCWHYVRSLSTSFSVNYFWHAA